MTDCDFIKIDGFWVCQSCQWRYPRQSDKPPRRNCHAKRTPEQIARAEAGLARLESDAIEAGAKLGWKPEHIKRWAGALLRWRSAGYPTRTDSEVTTIVAICAPCDQYAATEGRCRVCGCQVNTKGMAVFNKARMGSENCPRGKW